MITGTLPTQLIFEPAIPVKENLGPRIKAKKSFLYIGRSSDRTVNCLSFFDFSHTVIGFAEARKMLISLHESKSLPDFVVVDLPLAIRDLQPFVSWLHANKWSYMIPVLYNETILSERELVQLRESSLADDIVNIEEYCNQLMPKANLISQSKIINKKEHRRHARGIDYKEEAIPAGKRAFDILVASLALILVAPLLVIIAVLIKLESRGPVIYKSKRAGRGFKVFDFYKFRTMVQNADQIIDEYADLNVYHGTGSSRFIKIKNDPRITRIGGFLRNTSLDELPQLFNVLKGDMSIVGNRPLPLYEASTLTTNQSVERFSAPAGITGLWQVTKRGREDMDAEERVGLDIHYARQQSLYMDFHILLKTPLALLQKSNV